MLMTTAHANNPPPTIKGRTQSLYRQKGDTLWDISGRYLGQSMALERDLKRPISKSKVPTLFILTTFLFYV